MDHWDFAFGFMMDNEDPRRECALVHDLCPRGAQGPCYAISGINSGAFPAAFSVIQALPQKDRLAAVESFYKRTFWNQWLALIDSPDLAARVLDCAVNQGPGTACKVLQRAINALRHPDDELTVDGAWGPRTVAGANTLLATDLLREFKAERIAVYDEIPADEETKKEWIARAEK